VSERVRLKVDITADVKDIDEMKELFIKTLQGEDINFLNHRLTDGWCVGLTKYWHYAESSWGL
jgi:hypothetical protein